MDNYRDVDRLELEAFRSGQTYAEYCSKWVSGGPTDGRSAMMSKAEFIAAITPGLNKLFGLDGDSQEKNT